MKYLFCDFETTGLDERENCQIIEYAFHFWDGNAMQEKLQGFCEQFPPASWDPGAMSMHLKSGLLAEYLTAVKEKRTEYPNETARKVIEMLQRASVTPRECLLAGHGVHFDRRFLRQYMPALDEYLHYRHLDVSVLDTFFMDVVQVPRIAGNAAHRAADDVASSVRRFKEYQEAVAARFQGWVPASSIDPAKNS